MATSIGEIAGSMSIKTDGWEANLNRAAKTSKSAFKSMSDDMAMLGGAFKTLMAIGGASMSINWLNDLQSKFGRLSTVSQQTGRDLMDLKGAFNSVLSSVPVSADVATKAIDVLARRTTLMGDQFRQAAAQAAAANKLTGIDPKQLEVGSLGAMDQWKIPQTDIVAWNEMLYRIQELTDVHMGKLNDEMKQAAPYMQAFGFSALQSAQLLARLEQKGYDTEAVIRGLRAALKSIGESPTMNADPAGAFQKIAAYLRSSKDDARELADKIFGAKSGEEFVRIFRDSNLGLGELAQKMKDFHGDMIADAQEEMSGWQKIGAILQGTTNILGDFINTVLNKILPILDYALGVIKDYNNNPKKYDLFGSMGELMFGGVKYGEGYYKSLEMEAGVLGMNKNDITSGLWGARARPGMSPMMTEDSFAGYGVNAAAMATMSQSQKEVAKTTQDATAALNEEIDSFGKKLPPAAAQATEAVNQFKVNQRALFGEWKGWGPVLDNVTRKLSGDFTNSLMQVVNASKSAGDAFRQFGLTVVQELQRMLIQYEISEPLMTFLRGALPFAIGGGSGSGGGAAVSQIGASGFDAAPLPTFSWYADGGNFTPGPMVVGERGPEVLIPNFSGTIVPNHQLGGSNDVHVHQTINVQAGVPSAISAAIQQATISSAQQAASAVAQSIRNGGRASRIIRQVS